MPTPLIPLRDPAGVSWSKPMSAIFGALAAGCISQMG